MRVLGHGFFGVTWCSDDGKSTVKALGFGGEHGSSLERQVGELMKLEEHENLVLYKGYRLEKNEACVSADLHNWISADELCAGRLRLPEAALAYIVKQVLQGLEFLHGQNVVHGDLHASNILVDSETGGVKLTDYGISDKIRDGNMEHATIRHPLWWTAPELVSHQQEHLSSSKEGDIWALGATIIELADGKAPFSNLHPEQYRGHVLERGSLPKLMTAPTWSTYMNEFISMCVKFKPNFRASICDLLSHRFVQQADMDVLISAIASSKTNIEFPLEEMDPEDELERLYRSNCTILVPYLPLDSFPPEICAADYDSGTDHLRNGTANNDPTDDRNTAQPMVHSISAALQFHSDDSFLPPADSRLRKLRREDLESVLRNIQRM